MEVERLRIGVADGHELEGLIAWPAEPRGFAAAVPLVGGTGRQQIGLYRALTRVGIVVSSFTFRGHRGSDGTFSLAATVTDTGEAIEVLRERATGADLPFHLLGASYAAIPLLINLREHPEWDVRSFIIISGFAHVADFLAPIRVFLRRYARASGLGKTSEDLIRAVKADPSVVDRRVFFRMLHTYLSRQFPEVRVTRDRFEVLEYRRADMIHEIVTFSQGLLSPEQDLRSDVPSLWVHAHRDAILGVVDEASRRRYRARVRQVAPTAEFLEADVDHWARGPGHRLVAERAARFILNHAASRSS